jgi:N-hydroxyarylamine O-acetyltransferase
VRRRRGGFCYELNGLFAALLRALGFEVTLLAAGVSRADGGFGPEFDHLTLLVRATGDERFWLADVGFGDSFLEPLRFVEGIVQEQHGRAYRIDRDGEYWTLMQQDDGSWQPQYRFSLQPHEHAEYAAMCRYHQTSPESSFTRKRVCTLATPSGRVTLSDLTLISTKSGRRTEQLIAEQQYHAALREYFGVDLALEPKPSGS